MLTNLNILFQRLQDAEYAYLLLEELPLYGLFFGLIFFAIGLYMKQDKCRIAALVVVALCSGSAIWALKVRQKAQPRVVTTVEVTQGPVIKQQTALRQETIWVYYATGALAILTLVGGGKMGTWLNVVMLTGGGMAVIFTLWLHMKEAEVYHRNIKKGVYRAKVG